MKNNRKGIAMMLVLSLILMLLVLGGAALMISTGHFRSSYHQMDRGRAYYAGEAAMQHALWSLRTGQTALPTPGNSTPIAFPDANGINGIPQTDITITVEDENTGAETPLGVYPVIITVDY